MIIPSINDVPAAAYDFTIVGSGHAGLYLAVSLERSGFRVLIIEQGPLEDSLNQGTGYYEIDATGIDYLPLGERLASFGGTSGHWAGMSRPLAPTVFQDRSFLQCRGWPISYQEFAQHLDAASHWLGHDTNASEPIYVEKRKGILPGPTAGLVAHQFITGRPVRRLGKELLSWVKTSSSVDILSAHRVIDLTLDESGKNVASLHVVNTHHGDGGHQPVGHVILATGGIENARLMLSAGRKLPAGNPLTGRHSRTGRTFMEHPKYTALEVYIDKTFPLADTKWHPIPGDMVGWYGYSLEEKLFEHLKIPRFAVFFWGHASDQVSMDDTVRKLDRTLHGAERKYRISRPEIQVEQLPRDDSFIALSTKNDRHGQPLARMHWTLGEDELHTYWKSINIFASLLSQTEAVRIRHMYDTFDDFAVNAKPMVQHHHMGTTAMSLDDRTGVVDTNCRVHGMNNLHIAGSSVFPNGDYVNPTLNLLALADRQARYLVGLSK